MITVQHNVWSTLCMSKGAMPGKPQRGGVDELDRFIEDGGYICGAAISVKLFFNQRKLLGVMSQFNQCITAVALMQIRGGVAELSQRMFAVFVMLTLTLHPPAEICCPKPTACLPQLS